MVFIVYFLRHLEVCTVSRSFFDTISSTLSHGFNFPFFILPFNSNQLVLSSLFQGKTESFQVTQDFFCLVFRVPVA